MSILNHDPSRTEWCKEEPGWYIRGSMTITFETEQSAKALPLHSDQEPARGWWLWTGSEYGGPHKTLKRAKEAADG